MSYPLTCRRCHGAGAVNTSRLVRVRPHSNREGEYRLRCLDCRHEWDSTHPDAKWRPAIAQRGQSQ